MQRFIRFLINVYTMAVVDFNNYNLNIKICPIFLFFCVYEMDFLSVSYRFQIRVYLSYSTPETIYFETQVEQQQFLSLGTQLCANLQVIIIR